MIVGPKKKLLYGFSNIRSTQQFERLLLDLDQHFDLRILFYGPKHSLFPQVLQNLGLDVRVIPFETSHDLCPAIVLTLCFLIRWRPFIVHTHLRIATRILIPLSFLCCIPRRIHTRHHSVFHHRHFKKGVLADRVVNSLSTNVVAPSALVRRVLVALEKMMPQKVSVIHHWFDADSYHIPSRDRHISYPYSYPIILVNARFEHLKGHVFVIRAFHKLLQHYPMAKLRFANASGHDHAEILSLLESLLPPLSWDFVPFTNHPQDLYQSVNIFIHCPVDRLCESFGQVYIEGMAAGLPCIFTRSGIGLECLDHLENCLIVPHRSSEAIYNGMLQICNSSSLRAVITRGALVSSLKFTYSTHFSQILILYN
jgi:glycosyltransferase involved in cell wall biosynthesis